MILGIVASIRRSLAPDPPDPPAPGAPHLYWRIAVPTRQSGSTYTSVAELAMFAAGGSTNLCTGGTPRASSFYVGGGSPGGAGYGPANAFDASDVTIWASNGDGAAAWIGYQFPTPTAVSSFSVQVANAAYGTHGEDPQSIRFEWSDDGVSWTTMFLETGLAGWAYSEVRTFDLPLPAPNPVWANVRSLLHFNGAGGATTFEDEVPGSAWLGNSGAQLTTTAPFFGSASLAQDSDSYVNAVNFYPFRADSFCAEVWSAFTTVPTSRTAIMWIGYDTGVQAEAGGLIRVYASGVGTITTTKTIADAAKHHYALTRDGAGIMKLWIDGFEVASFLRNAHLGDRQVWLGIDPSNGYQAEKTMDEFRLTIGDPVYTAAFAPPAGEFPGAALATDPYWSNVVALLNFDGATASTVFTDDAGNHSWTSVGGAAQDGAGNGVFNGTSQTITTPYVAVDQIGTGDFTLEAFAQMSAITGDFQMIAVDQGSSSDFIIQMRFSPTGVLEVVYGNSGIGITTASDVAPSPVNTLRHLEFCRKAGVVGVFVDGVSIHTAANANIFSLSLTAGWSLASYQGSLYWMGGKIAGFRYTVGTSRHDPGVNFTPPTLPYPTG